MSHPRTLRITSLRQRVEREEYRVDVDKVAEAILGRPTARMLILPTGTAVRHEEASVEDEPEPASSSDGVLEAA